MTADIAAKPADMPFITPRAVAIDGPGLAMDPAHLRLNLRTSPLAALATRDPGGHPFATLTNIATDSDGSPLFLTSQLALHGRNAAANNRVSLSFQPLARDRRGQPGAPSRHGRTAALAGLVLARARLTVSGHAAIDDDPRVRQRFLTRHRKTAAFAQMQDFHIWRVTVAAGHYGLGIDPVDLILDLRDAETLVAAESELLATLNGSHAATLSRLASRLAGALPGAWRATGIDPEGLDLALGDETARLTFQQAVHSPEAALPALELLLDEAM
ncbi:HugZ family pyridoxamine 5'-phosphate oxidase [Chelatococcus asaccharovorans]|uniref:HugZ family pyridoxamine 5'-phosphate oxidase n=1 Tax=Chelatococcus asaccharovorans TaxID=28210 RepID=UPI00224C677A|nr:pyridoxamine 5'-phosphate oxidase family protein [Chelatococcus asaccharovorans]CAH1658635.1 HugZ family protein [Chelatococcus asaccharovorans]CAH1684449.1 HugZ family protein [Chelatococcus asaccharovorans]